MNDRCRPECRVTRRDSQCEPIFSLTVRATRPPSGHSACREALDPAGASAETGAASSSLRPDGALTGLEEQPMLQNGGRQELPRSADVLARSLPYLSSCLRPVSSSAASWGAC